MEYIMEKKKDKLIYRYLICEYDHKLSLGRVTFWILLCMNTYYWMYLQKDVPDTLFNSWWIILIYNLSKKGLRVFGEIFNKGQVSK